MKVLALIASAVLLFQIFTTIKDQEKYKKGGDVLGIFKQSSFLTKSILAIFILSLLFAVWAWKNFGDMALSNIPILCYLLIMLYNYSRKIEVLTGGIFISGKFLNWNLINKVEVGPNNSIKLILKNDKYKVYVVDQVEDVEGLRKLIKKGMKG